MEWFCRENGSLHSTDKYEMVADRNSVQPKLSISAINLNLKRRS